MAHAKNYLALDVGEKRIGIAIATDGIKIAVPSATVEADGTEFQYIADLVADKKIDTIIIGYPRNQAGDATAQSAYVETFAAQLHGMGAKVVFQDESLTSVMAENYLKSQNVPYTKGDIDAKAAALILQDYLEQYT